MKTPLFFTSGGNQSRRLKGRKGGREEGGGERDAYRRRRDDHSRVGWAENPLKKKYVLMRRGSGLGGGTLIRSRCSVPFNADLAHVALLKKTFSRGFLCCGTYV